MKKVYELDFRGRNLTIEIGEMAKQANGAVLVRYGDTVILSTAVVSKNCNVLADFFPLMVLYKEKLYDKRETIKERDIAREVKKQLKNNYY